MKERDTERILAIVSVTRDHIPKFELSVGLAYPSAWHLRGVRLSCPSLGCYGIMCSQEPKLKSTGLDQNQRRLQAVPNPVLDWVCALVP